MKNEEPLKGKFILQPYTKKELRALYGNISRTTFYRWLKDIPEIANSKSTLLNVLQVEAILKKHGIPGERQFN